MHLNGGGGGEEGKKENPFLARRESQRGRERHMNSRLRGGKEVEKKKKWWRRFPFARGRREESTFPTLGEKEDFSRPSVGNGKRKKKKNLLHFLTSGSIRKKKNSSITYGRGREKRGKW